MSDLINRLRGYFVPSSYHDIRSLLTSAADALEAKDKEIAAMKIVAETNFASAEQYRLLCDQLGRALDGHCAPFLGHEEEHRLALEAWRATK